MNRLVSFQQGYLNFNYKNLTEDIRVLVRVLLRDTRRQYLDLGKTINFNSIQHVSADAQPTPAENRMLIWNDTDAGAGQPTHYLVVNFGGSVVTFASKETA